MNDHSSRSHAVFVINIKMTEKKSGTAKTSRIFIVDLAGTENREKTGAEGKRAEESDANNLSLGDLRSAIISLQNVEGMEKRKNQGLFRNSPLNGLLSSGINGNSMISIIITVSPEMSNSEETVATCKFGSLANEITLDPKVNVVKRREDRREI